MADARVGFRSAPVAVPAVKGVLGGGAGGLALAAGLSGDGQSGAALFGLFLVLYSSPFLVAAVAELVAAFMFAKAGVAWRSGAMALDALATVLVSAAVLFAGMVFSERGSPWPLAVGAGIAATWVAASVFVYLEAFRRSSPARDA